MSLQHCIIHKISRAQPGAAITIATADQALPTMDSAVSLFEQVKFSYLRSAQKQFGFFDREQHSPVPGWLQEFHNDKISFIRLSHELIKHLAGCLEANSEVFNAHILLAFEQSMDNTIGNLFWLEHKEAPMIDSNLHVGNSHYIDTSRISYGLRLNVTEWLHEQSPKYLSVLIPRGNKAISDAFNTFASFSAGLDLKQDTQEFLTILDDYSQQLPNEESQRFRHTALDYCVQQDAQGAPVVFEDLSQQLDEQAPDRFAQFVSNQQTEPKPSLHTDRSTLKRYVRFFGRDRDMSISFSADRFGDDVLFNANTGELTLQKLPKALKAQLVEQLKKT